MARAEFSKKTKLEAFARANGRCEVCGVKILSGAEYDHIIEETLTHDNSLLNCRCTCVKCHRAKTRRNRPEIDKTRRVLLKRAGIRTPKGKPMPGTKASGWRHKVSGEWERRS